MKDNWNREINYIRISVTDRCNLRCVYCMPEEGVTCFSHSEVLSYEEIIRLARIWRKLGISRVKLTGGEPLVRKNLDTLVRALKADCGMESVTLTTNGVLLKEQIKGLVDAGLDAVNISLDTLERKKYEKITRRDRLSDTIAGIRETLRYPELTVKLNCVPTEANVDEVAAIAGLAREQKLAVRFIEMMPIGLGQGKRGIPEEQIQEILEKAYGPLTPCSGQEAGGNGPAHYAQIEGFAGKIGFISAISHQFCGSCNRIRLTSDGKLKTCLQYGETLDVRALLRDEAVTDMQIEEQLLQEIFRKPQGHHFREKKAWETAEEHVEQHTMSKIGG